MECLSGCTGLLISDVSAMTLLLEGFTIHPAQLIPWKKINLLQNETRELLKRNPTDGNRLSKVDLKSLLHEAQQLQVTSGQLISWSSRTEGHGLLVEDRADELRHATDDIGLVVYKAYRAGENALLILENFKNNR